MSAILCEGFREIRLKRSVARQLDNFYFDCTNRLKVASKAAQLAEEEYRQEVRFQEELVPTVRKVGGQISSRYPEVSGQYVHLMLGKYVPSAKAVRLAEVAARMLLKFSATLPRPKTWPNRAAQRWLGFLRRRPRNER